MSLFATILVLKVTFLSHELSHFIEAKLVFTTDTSLRRRVLNFSYQVRIL